MKTVPLFPMFPTYGKGRQKPPTAFPMLPMTPSLFPMKRLQQTTGPNSSELAFALERFEEQRAPGSPV